MDRTARIIPVLLMGLVMCGGVARAAEIGGEQINLLENPSFESTDGGKSWPEPWMSYSFQEQEDMTPAEGLRRTGMQSMRLAARGAPGDFEGVIQVVPVTGGEYYTFKAYLLNDRNERLGGSAYVQLVIEWRDKDGVEVGRDYGAQRDAGLSQTRWDPVELSEKQAPSSAVRAVVGIHLFEGGQGGEGAILVDDVELVKTKR